MRTVNIAALKAKLSEYVRFAKEGETVHIYDRHQPVAVLSGITISEGEQTAAALIREGLAAWQGGKPSVQPVRPRKGPAALADAVVEDRG